MIGKYQRMISANPDLANQTPRLSLMVRLLVNSGTGGGGATKKFPGVPLFARFRSVDRIFAAMRPSGGVRLKSALASQASLVSDFHFGNALSVGSNSRERPTGPSARDPTRLDEAL